LPKLASSVDPATSAATPFARSHASASSRVGIAKSTRRQRLRIVAGRRDGSSATSMMIVLEAGSSSVFRRAFAAFGFIASAGSMIAICKPPN